MNRKNKSTGTRWIIVFILLVGLTGLGLAATGHLSNPFGFLTQGQGRAEGRPPAGNSSPANSANLSSANQTTGSQNASAPTNAQFPPNGGSDRGEGGQISINWSQIGDVLFNLWYLFVTTAVIIVVQKVGGYLIRQIRQRVQPAALA